GSPLRQVVTNPLPGSHEIYVVTAAGVYHMADTRTPAHWDNITGNVFALQNNVFGDPTLASNILSTSATLPSALGLTSIQADWRFAIPDNPANPIGPKHPVLYNGGDGGVFRSLDRGVSWT